MKLRYNAGLLLLEVRKCSLEKVSSCCTIMQSLHMRSNRVEGQRADFTEEARGFIKIKPLEKEKVPVDEPSENDSAAIFGIRDISAQRLTSFCNPPPAPGCVVSLLIARLI